MSNRHLFIGEESYRLHQELQRRSNNFIDKYGSDTVFSFSLDAGDLPEEIMQALMSGGLFADKKLIILHDIPGGTTNKAGTAELEEALQANRERINPDYFLILVSTKPDKRKRAYKFFKKQCELKEFKPMDLRSLPKFIREEFELHNTTDETITRPQTKHIVELVGNDGRRLSHEIKKLAHYLESTGSSLNEKTINTIITPSPESNAFDLLEVLVKDSGPKLLTTIDTLLVTGVAWQQVQGGLLRGLKTLVAFVHALENGYETSSLGLPRFTLARYAKRSDKLLSHKQGYQNLYFGLIDYEYQIKTGQADNEGYRLHLKSLLQANNFI